MHKTFNPPRLFVEILAVVALAQAVAMLVLPVLAPGATPSARLLLSAALLVLLAGPAVYWRCMAAAWRGPKAADNPPVGTSDIRTAIAMTAAAQVVGLMLTAAGVAWQQRTIDAVARSTLERSTDRIETEVARRLGGSLNGLKGTRAMFAAGPAIDRRGFHDYVEARDLSVEFPGVRGIGFIQRVMREDLARFVATERADNAPDFAVRGQGDASVLFVVKQIEPLRENLAAWGVDIGQDPVRREAAQRAVDTGQPALTGRVVLPQDENRGAGLVYLVPIYRHGANPMTVPQRQAALVGLLYMPIVVNELMSGAVGGADKALNYALFEGLASDAGSLIFDSASPSRSAAGTPSAAQTASAADAGGPVIEASRKIMVGGRVLGLRVRSSPAFNATIDRSGLMVAGVGGVLGSFMMALTVWLLSAGRVRAQRRAQRMTADLDQLARVVQHTSNAVTISDAQNRITWVNEGFTRITGYSLADAAGRMPGELLGSGKSDSAVIEALLGAVAAGQACRAEVLNRAKDGHEYWMSIEVQPTHDAHGGLIGFMEVGSEITAQKRTHLQLADALRGTDALLRTVHQHAIVSVANRRGQIIEVNDAFCAISGYSREELLGQDHRIVNSAVQPAAFWVDMWRTIASGAPWRGEICNRAKDGSLYWVDSMLAPFVGADGEIEKYVSIRTDITASKLAQQRMNELADRLTLATEATSDGLWDWPDMRSRSVWWSTGYYAQLGYAPDELESTIENFRSLLHPDHVAPSLKAAEDALASGLVMDIEYLLRTKSGEYRWFRSRGKVYRDAAGKAVRMSGATQDIHDRKLAERDLVRERRRLDNILEGTNVGTWEWNVQTGETRLNERWASMLGYTLSELDASTIATWEKFTHADDLVRAGQLLERHFRGEFPYYEAELRMKHKAGHWVWVLARGKLFARTDDGRPRWMAGTHMDISDRHAIDEQLQRSNDLMKGVLENLPCALSVFDGDLQLVAHNPEFRSLLGLPDSLFDGPTTSFQQIIRYNAERGEYGQGRVEDIVASIVERARKPTAHLIERERENGVTMEIRGAPMPGGGFVTTYTNVAERKRAEQALKAAHEDIETRSVQLQATLDNISQGVAMIGADGKVVFQSDRAKALLELPEYLRHAEYEEIIKFQAARGDFGKNYELVDEAGRELVKGSALEGFGKVPLYTRTTPSGRALEIHTTPVPEGGWVRTFADVTEHVQALRRAEQASIAKSQFLANMSHEIRTPMNAILGMLRLLQNTALTPRQLDYASKTEGAARSLLGLLNDILDFSKVEAGKMTLDPRPFRIDRLLRDLSVILSATVGAKDIEVHYDIDPALPRSLIGDDMRLQQVLINLGGNAIKFTSVGQVVLSLRALEFGDDDVLLEFAMRDSGIGIAPENQAHIFGGFSQAEASTTRRFGGTGLGLAICQRLVGLMGGEIRIDSVLGEGSTFYFQIRLGLIDSAVDEPLALPPPEMAALSVLIVDDNASAREGLATMAQSLGWQADVAASGAAAISMARERIAAGASYQVIFVEWQMPGLDGWETSQRIRQMAGEASLVVMVTAHDREMLAQRSLQDQAMLNGFLIKPVTASMLFDAVVDARVALAHPNLARLTQTPKTQRLAGLRLLVVEDNLNNQQVAQELLADEGAHVALANNGRLGVAAVMAADPPFDVVLMDVQMPVMDGYEAAAAIRQHFSLAALPIVAMTANAMASDREACLAAGMNDHVGKPFDLDHLVATLLRLAGRAAVPAAGSGANRGEEKGPEEKRTGVMPALLAEAARHGIDLAGALHRMGGNSAVYLRLLQSFAKDLLLAPQQLAALLPPGQTGQREEASRLMHTLKGLAATLGVQPLAEVASDAERCLLGAEVPAQQQALIDALSATLATTLPAIMHVAQAMQLATPRVEADAGAPPIDISGLRGSLDELCALLGSADMRALDLFAKLQQAHGAHLNEQLLPIDNAMAALDFDAALAHCQALLKGFEP